MHYTTTNGLIYQYVYSSGHLVYQANSWKRHADLNKNYIFTCGDSTVQINHVLAFGPYEYYAGTNKGLYRTKYKYTIVNDLDKFNILSARQLYNEKLPGMTSTT